MTRWGGRRVTRIRAQLAQTLPRPCPRCGRDVMPWQDWQVDHLAARAITPGWDPFDPRNLGVAHTTCNHLAGQQVRRTRRRDRAAWSRPWLL